MDHEGKVIFEDFDNLIVNWEFNYLPFRPNHVRILGRILDLVLINDASFTSHVRVTEFFLWSNHATHGVVLNFEKIN